MVLNKKQMKSILMGVIGKAAVYLTQCPLNKGYLVHGTYRCTSYVR